MDKSTGEGIERRECWSLSHYYYGEAYFGSYKGMRYRIAREPLKSVIYDPPEVKAAALFKVSIWPEPFAYAKTPPEAITDSTFPFTEEGLDEAVMWLNDSYLLQADRWKQASGR